MGPKSQQYYLMLNLKCLKKKSIQKTRFVAILKCSSAIKGF